MLIEITKDKFDVEIEIAYATKNNFTGDKVYQEAGCYLHADAADCLVTAINLAKELGYRLKMFDAFRPHEAQWKLWNHTPDPNFLSHPETGSLPHCRGVAIDLTLLSQEGNELDMGTKFDEFTEKSHHGRIDISKQAQFNRYILMGIMTTAGWDFYRNEWWHYQLFNPRKYQIFTDKEAHTQMM